MALKKRTLWTSDGKRTLETEAKESRPTQTGELDRYLNNGKPVEPVVEPESELDRYYRTAQQQLDAGKRAAQQDAAVSMETLQKYLPIQAKMNGLSGLGVSESAGIDAYNKYISNLGTIEQNHAADSAALLENYAAAKKQEDAEARSAQDTVFEEYMTLLQSGAYNSPEELDRYLERARGRVNADQYAQLETYVAYAKDNPENKALWDARKWAEEQKAVKQNGVSFYENDDGDYGLDAGDDVTLVDDSGTTYGVESRGAVTDSAVIAAASSVANNSIFAYGGKIYYKINGTLYEVGGRSGNNSTAAYTSLYERFYGGTKNSQGEDSDGVITLSDTNSKTKAAEDPTLRILGNVDHEKKPDLWKDFETEWKKFLNSFRKKEGE